MLLKIIQELEKNIITEVDHLKSARKTTSSTARNVATSVITDVVPPVLQLNNMPEPIDISQYKNPKGPTNPNGDYKSLYKFSDLANNISQFNQFYFRSGNKIDDVYQNIVQGASVKEDATFTSFAFKKSNKDLADSKLSNLAGTPKNWFPVYASPSDWFDRISGKENLFASEINFSNPSESFDSQFAIIGESGNQDLKWNQKKADGTIIETATNNGSVFNKIKFKYLQVQLDRPWLNFDIFTMGGWYLGGQGTGYLSSGDLIKNRGVFPLYPTSFIIATDLQIEGKLHDVDTKFVSDNISEKGSVNLGPFNISEMTTDKASKTTTMNNDGYFILAWINQLVDLSPKINN